ncbi:ADP-ribosylglycohydrolase family protein [Marinobacter sp. chi1]|uniref:ADP-ribosylglycohydrolase family protein n=1 Tax=Marinobacter suaedae TaxID=3057675 RepID=A0ABT8W3C9_9GAMM|nr:ADP-ribosylglycohydrolase family protein [Marinobacter sp. chi1]MDO3722759.1 ADP-ribosylglycohydrolase family protein [Marinobacter sp. chi1]
MTKKPPEERRTRMLAALSGGWVADAAGLGLHWLYSSERILDVAGQRPEFLSPRVDYFDGVFGFFAHEGKKPGDMSHYGAATKVLTDSLLANDGQLNVRDYQRRFVNYFGPGGGWQGFIDNPTRWTLINLAANEQKAIEEAFASIDTDLTDKQKRVLVQKVMPYVRRLSGVALAAPVREAINLTYKESGIQDAGVFLAQTIDRKLSPESGADDTQLPAVSKLPPLVACYAGKQDLMAQVDAAVRVTNNSDEAVAWAHCTARLLEGLFLGQALAEAMDAAAELAPDAASLAHARTSAPLDAINAGDTFGRTCYLDEAMPVSFHIISQAQSFAEAVRANIHCGGDSCGRAWLIGPAMAAIHGVGGERGIPLSWLSRVTGAADLYGDLEALIPGER